MIWLTEICKNPKTAEFMKSTFKPGAVIISYGMRGGGKTHDPETLPVGGYAYDYLSSAVFSVGEFPFHEFVRYISGKSSFGMAKATREFYDTLGTDAPVTPDRAKEEARGRWK